MTEQKEVLVAAQSALTDAFGPNHKHTVKITSTPAQGLTSSDLNTILAEVGAKPIITPPTKVESSVSEANVHNASFKPIPESSIKQKSIAESKKLIENFKENLNNYPKHLSYEGSVVLCSLIGLKQTNNINLQGLPRVDQDLIFSQLPPPETLNGRLSFSVELDDQQDFKLTCEEICDDKIPSRKFNLRFFNSVLRPSNFPTDIAIEQDGENVKVGPSLVLGKRRIQQLVGTTPKDTSNQEDATPRRQVVSGRNAFELRCDLVQMSMDLLLHNNRTNDISPEKVIATAKILYSFVENKR